MNSVQRLMIALAALATLSACGIDSGPVVLDHPAEKAGQGTETGAKGPPKRGDVVIADPVDLVKAFLRASAGDSATRDTVLRSYILGGNSWKPASELRLVHILDQNPKAIKNLDDSYTVNLPVQHIGTLNDSGQVIPSTEGVKQYLFTIASKGSDLFLREPPKDLLLSDAGLEAYYIARPIYFQSGDKLVPDIRYVSQSLSLEQQSNQLVDWLYEGPSAWLSGAVKKLPAETRPGVTKVVRGENNTLVIDLSASPGDVEFRQLAAQLAKTLVVGQLTGLQVRVQGQVKASSEKPADESQGVRAANRYAVTNGRVQRLIDNPAGFNDVWLSAEVNKNVVAAAIARDERAAAIVQGGSGFQQLWIGTRSRMVTASLPSVSQITQLSWLDHDSQILLVLADSGIYQVGPDGKAELKLQIKGLTGMSVAPDGRRLALVIDGVLHLVSRSENGTITFSQTQIYRVPTIFDVVQAASFSGRSELIIAGSDARSVRLLRMNLDGTQQVSLSDQWQLGITIRHLVADAQSGNALFELQGDAYEVRQNGSVRLAEKLSAGSPGVEGKPKVSAPSFEG